MEKYRLQYTRKGIKREFTHEKYMELEPFSSGIKKLIYSNACKIWKEDDVDRLCVETSLPLSTNNYNNKIDNDKHM